MAAQYGTLVIHLLRHFRRGRYSLAGKISFFGIRGTQSRDFSALWRGVRLDGGARGIHQASLMSVLDHSQLLHSLCRLSPILAPGRGPDADHSEILPGEQATGFFEGLHISVRNAFIPSYGA